MRPSSSPWESSHDKLRDECLNMEVFNRGREAQVIVEAWREHYNGERPHSSLGYLTPDEFAAMMEEGGVASPVGSLRPPKNNTAQTGLNPVFWSEMNASFS